MTLSDLLRQPKIAECSIEHVRLLYNMLLSVKNKVKLLKKMVG